MTVRSDIITRRAQPLILSLKSASQEDPHLVATPPTRTISDVVTDPKNDIVSGIALGPQYQMIPQAKNTNPATNGTDYELGLLGANSADLAIVHGMLVQNGDLTGVDFVGKLLQNPGISDTLKRKARAEYVAAGVLVDSPSTDTATFFGPTTTTDDGSSDTNSVGREIVIGVLVIVIAAWIMQ